MSGDCTSGGAKPLGLALCAVLLGSATVHAEERLSPSAELVHAEHQIDELRRVQIQGNSAAQQARTPEQRMASGEYRFGLRDYVRASYYFLDVVENFPRFREHSRAVFLLGESLYRSREREGARKNFESLLEQCSGEACAKHVELALVRLINMALQQKDWQAAQRYVDHASRLRSDPHTTTLVYARAKHLYLREAMAPQQDAVKRAASYRGAARLFADVPPDNPNYHRARYFQAAIFTELGEFAQALALFRELASVQVPSKQVPSKQAPSKEGLSATQRRARADVADLARLAIGRIHYELRQPAQAIAAYQSIARSSRWLGVALYEISWVYLQQGDTQKARDALQVLELVSNDPLLAVQARLLLGELLVQDGRYNDADKVFAQVVDMVLPRTLELRRVATQHADLQGYFKALLQQTEEPPWPEPVAAWAKRTGQLQRPRRLMLDVRHIQSMVEEIELLAETFAYALAAPRRVASFDDTRRYREHSIVLRNRLAWTRAELMAEATRSKPGTPAVSPEGLVEVRRRRQQEATEVRRLPMNQAALRERDQAVLQRYECSAKELQRLEVEVVGIHASIKSAEHFLAAGERRGKVRDDAEALKDRIAEHRATAREHAHRIRELKRRIVLERLGVGVGDAHDREDERLRRSFAAVVKAEQERMAMANMPVRHAAALARIVQAEASLDAFDARIDAAAEQRSAQLLQLLQKEKNAVVGYRTEAEQRRLEAAEVGAEALVIYHRYLSERYGKFLKNAEIGSANVSWARREEHREIVDLLSRQRAERLQAIDGDYRQIIDDTESNGDSTPSSGGP